MNAACSRRPQRGAAHAPGRRPGSASQAPRAAAGPPPGRRSVILRAAQRRASVTPCQGKRDGGVAE